MSSRNEFAVARIKVGDMIIHPETGKPVTVSHVTNYPKTGEKLMSFDGGPDCLMYDNHPVWWPSVSDLKKEAARAAYEEKLLKLDFLESTCLHSALNVAIKHIQHEVAMSREPDESKVEFLEGMNDLREKLTAYLKPKDSV